MRRKGIRSLTMLGGVLALLSLPLGQSAQALTCDDTTLVCEDDDVPIRAVVATIGAFDQRTGRLTYTDPNGVTRVSVVTPTTAVRRAPILRFVPNDPIFPVVVQWNELVRHQNRNEFGPTDPTVSFSSLTQELAFSGAHMRVKLNADNTVKRLRPIP